MKQTIWLIAVICFTLMLLCASQLPGNAEQKTPMGYELYSWQDSSGGWSFCVLYNTSSEKTVREVFNKKTELRGVDQLKHRISQLPTGASISWVNRLPTAASKPKAKGSEGLKYPPTEIMEDVKRFAEAHGVTIFGQAPQ
jgi:hypothetical protein